ncbi:MAG: sigma-70 family RNA polymerase sigma factor [Phycisphaerales bacterium]|nr:sigma-70 family RNA polymerase sigma factor [Phycisphaerales bacterium]
MTQVPYEDGCGGASMDALMPLVYDELRAIAGSFLRGQGSHTLQPTALVHEAFVKLDRGPKRWTSREHFMSTAARAMRQILVDHARRKNAEKRGGSAGLRISLDAIPGEGAAPDITVSEIDELLTELQGVDPRAAQIAEMRIFAGMNHEEAAVVLGTSRTSVSNDWQFARAWLAARLMGAQHG